MVMIKSELINQMAEKQKDLPPEHTKKAVNLLLEYMTSELSRKNGKGRIEIRSFGSIVVRFRPPRNAHNPKTGERGITKPKYVPYFKPGKELRYAVNASRDHYPITHGEDHHNNPDEDNE